MRATWSTLTYDVVYWSRREGPAWRLTAGYRQGRHLLRISETGSRQHAAHEHPVNQLYSTFRLSLPKNSDLHWLFVFWTIYRLNSLVPWLSDKLRQTWAISTLSSSNLAFFCPHEGMIKKPQYQLFTTAVGSYHVQIRSKEF